MRVTKLWGSKQTLEVRTSHFLAQETDSAVSLLTGPHPAVRENHLQHRGLVIHLHQPQIFIVLSFLPFLQRNCCNEIVQPAGNSSQHGMTSMDSAPFCTARSERIGSPTTAVPAASRRQTPGLCCVFSQVNRGDF